MIILVYGDDDFRMREKVLQLKEAFLKKFDQTGMNLAMFPTVDRPRLEAAEVLQAACSLPFLSSKRMVVVGGLFSQVKKEDEGIWLDGFARLPETSIVVFWEATSPASLEKKGMFKAIEKLGEVHRFAFPQLEGTKLSDWVQGRVRAKGGEIEPAAVRELVTRVGADLWQMNGEIDKLFAFAVGKRVTKQMVEMLVPASFEGRIFELMDAISKKQIKRAIALLEQERLAGSDDHYLLTMLGRQVRILLSARAFLDRASPLSEGGMRGVMNEFAAASGLHPFPAQKALEQARLFNLDDLTRAHDLLFEYDLNIKTGRMPAGLAVDLLTDRFIHS